MTPDFNSIAHLIEKVEAFKTPDGDLFESKEEAIAHIMQQLTRKISTHPLSYHSVFPTVLTNSELPTPPKREPNQISIESYDPFDHKKSMN